MSIPKAEQTTKSTAKPTPIKYLGFSFGRTSVDAFTIFQKSSLASPPLNPPTANPGTGLSMSSLAHSIRFSALRPPCTIGKRFWSCCLAWAEIQRSSQRTVLSCAT
uniref:Uncharacterized protein n=1 Tax=Lepeophtheirus salmonis TaxID=72036 RepID=A0A0K2TES0_LEPSM